MRNTKIARPAQIILVVLGCGLGACQRTETGDPSFVLAGNCGEGTDGCDDDPPACVAVPKGSSCQCPGGFTGTGLGHAGCLLADPGLLSLVPSDGALNPGFSATTAGYTLALHRGATSVALTPSILYPGHATILVDATPVDSGTTFTIEYLGLARQPVKITVTTETGESRAYEVVLRPTPPIYIKASNTGASDAFGHSVALSADGLTLAVGAIWEASAAFDGGVVQSDDSAPGAGAVYVFNRTGWMWTQQAFLKARSRDARDYFGVSVALSADGDTLAVGAYEEDSSARGVDGDQSSNATPGAGAAYVFTRSGETWAEQAYLKASNAGAHDYFGYSVALSPGGDTLAVGAYGEDSSAKGVGGDQANDDSENSGAAYVFIRTRATWTQQAYLKASDASFHGYFGDAVALSRDGSLLAVGAPGAGTIHLFNSTAAGWVQEATIKSSSSGVSDGLGRTVALSQQGSTLAAVASGGAYDDVYVFGRADTGWVKQQRITDAMSAALSSDGAMLAVGKVKEGIVSVFTRTDTAWSQQEPIEAYGRDAGSAFGFSLAFSADGGTLSIGAPGEGSGARGVGGDPDNDDQSGSGAVFLFSR